MYFKYNINWGLLNILRKLVKYYEKYDFYKLGYNVMEVFYCISIRLIDLYVVDYWNFISLIKYIYIYIKFSGIEYESCICIYIYIYICIYFEF